MNTAVLALRDETAQIKPQPRKSFHEEWMEAKLDADGGIVFFEAFRGVFTAYYEDAEIIGETLGVTLTPPATGFAPSVSLKAKHLYRNFRLLRCAGYEDIWIASLGARPNPVDDIGENSFTEIG